jgi:alkylation response protein AidB-like acyl-CoA dehydrogenase
MDFEDTAQEAKFRAEVRAFLDANAKRKDASAVTGYRAGHDRPEALTRAKEWQAKKSKAGYAGITLPKEWGGQGGTPIQQVIFDQEEQNYQVPRGFFDIGIGMCVPTIGTWGTQAQRDRHIPATLSAAEVWCQLFSEPAGGSDLAALRTRAVRDGDEWVVNGSKIWTSGAHYSDWGILVTRTDPNVPKHAGLTFFFLSMKSPGIEIRPIKQMSGASNFNEVFFTDVRIPDSQRLGPVGAGWKVSITTLMNERFTVGGFGPDASDLFELARHVELEDGPAIRNKAVRDKIADWYLKHQGLKYTKFRTMTALSKGATPGPEASIGKLVSAPAMQDIAAYALDLMGMSGALIETDEMPMSDVFQQAVLYSPALRIAGGTDEVMRNIIAERVLNLPQDARVDKGIPFKDVPTGPR